MKHSFTTFITTLLLSVFLAIPALAYDVEVDGIYYTIDGNTVSVTCGDIKYSGDIVIPESITINDTKYNVTSIEDIAFWFCTNLTSVSIPNSVTSIGVAAFSHCSELSSVVIPNSVKRIERETFEFCYRLKSVTIPNSVTSIGNSAFSNCSSLTTVTIPNSVTNIGDNVFLDCAGLTRPIIVNDMFVFLPKGYTGHYTIPENISKIIGGAFFCCCELTSVTIPNSVTSIGNGAFFYCIALKDVFSYADNVPNTEISAFDRTDLECATLHVPASAMKKYKTTEPWSKFGTITEIIETGIISTLNHSNSIQSADGFVTISGLESSEQVDFFSTEGKALGRAKAMGGTATFAAQSGSMVVAKIGKESVKIVVK